MGNKTDGTLPLEEFQKMFERISMGLRESEKVLKRLSELYYSHTEAYPPDSDEAPIAKMRHKIEELVLLNSQMLGKKELFPTMAPARIKEDEDEGSRVLANCAACPYKLDDRLCRKKGGKAPAFCPTRNHPELIKESLRAYAESDMALFAKQASIQEAEGYANRDMGYDKVRPAKSRIEEIIEFARKMNYKRLGMAFCIGLRKEAKVVENIFSEQGFEMVSVVCKSGRVPKEMIGIRDDQKIAVGKPESMCNPILQAMILNDAETEFNIMLGLCVGHDSMFLKYADAPCTVLAVKDRLLGHNPLAAVYNADSYYRALKK